MARFYVIIIIILRLVRTYKKWFRAGRKKGFFSEKKRRGKKVRAIKDILEEEGGEVEALSSPSGACRAAELTAMEKRIL